MSYVTENSSNNRGLTLLFSDLTAPAASCNIIYIHFYYTRYFKVVPE
jgi:hypothetical protein